MHLGADKTVENQPFISVGQSGAFITGIVGEVQFRFLQTETHAGRLGHHLDIDGLTGLYA